MASLADLRQRFAGIYPGWWVVGACCFLALFPGAIFSYGFPVFYIPIREDLMLTDTQVSLIFALSRGEAGAGGRWSGGWWTSSTPGRSCWFSG